MQHKITHFGHSLCKEKYLTILIKKLMIKAYSQEATTQYMGINDDGYTSFSYTLMLKFQRKPTYYIMNSILPCLILNMIILIGLALGEKQTASS